MTYFLTLDVGSSSIKFAMFEGQGAPQEILRGQVEWIGTTPRLKVSTNAAQDVVRDLPPDQVKDHAAALQQILSMLSEGMATSRIVAVGHRVVHGGTEFTVPVVVTAENLERMRDLAPLAPLHQPHNLAGIEAAQKAFPSAVQLACFDTAFHQGHPWVTIPTLCHAAIIRRVSAVMAFTACLTIMSAAA